MQDGAKKRLAGAVVVITLAIVFVPMLFEDQASQPAYVPGPLSPESSAPGSFDAPYPNQGFAPLPPGTQTLTEAEAQLTPAEPLQSFAPADPEAAVDDGDALVFDPVQEPNGPFAAAPLPTPTATAAPRQAPAVSRPPPRSTPPPAPRREASVSAPPPPAPPPPKPRSDAAPVWIVQVASLGSADAAGKLADKLKQSGFSAFVESAVVNGKTYYRVRVGPSNERDQANRLADKLRKQHKLDTLIQRYSQ